MINFVRQSVPHDLNNPVVGLLVVEVWTIPEDYSSRTGSYQLLTITSDEWTVDIFPKIETALLLSEPHVKSVRMRVNEWNGTEWMLFALWTSEKGLTCTP